MTPFPETRESLLVQVKDPSNRDARGGLLDRKLHPTLSLIATEKTTLSQNNRTREGHLLFTLDHGMIVDIDFESPDGLMDKLQRFREANPSATSISVPVPKSSE